MQSEKLAFVSVTLVIVVVGLFVGLSFMSFPNDSGGNNVPLTRTTQDTDLLDLGLGVPDSWTFEMSDGTTLSLSDLEGQVVLIDLMATWCTTCASQNTVLEIISEDLAGTAVVISLTVDDSETALDMANYKSNKDLLWGHGVDTGGSFQSYFSVSSIPTMVLIDADGIFRYMHVGTWSVSSITDTIASIL